MDNPILRRLRARKGNDLKYWGKRISELNSARGTYKFLNKIYRAVEANDVVLLQRLRNQAKTAYRSAREQRQTIRDSEHNMQMREKIQRIKTNLRKTITALNKIIAQVKSMRN